LGRKEIEKMTNPLTNEIHRLQERIEELKDRIASGPSVPKIIKDVKLFCADCCMAQDAAMCGLCSLNMWKEL